MDQQERNHPGGSPTPTAATSPNDDNDECQFECSQVQLCVHARYRGGYGRESGVQYAVLCVYAIHGSERSVKTARSVHVRTSHGVVVFERGSTGVCCRPIDGSGAPCITLRTTPVVHFPEFRCTRRFLRPVTDTNTAATTDTTSSTTPSTSTSTTSSPSSILSASATSSANPILGTTPTVASPPLLRTRPHRTPHHPPHRRRLQELRCP